MCEDANNSLETPVTLFGQKSEAFKHISLFRHSIGHVSGAPNGGHFGNPYAKKGLNKLEGPTRQGHISLHNLAALCSQNGLWRVEPSNWSHSNPFGQRIANMTIIWRSTNMTS